MLYRCTGVYTRDMGLQRPREGPTDVVQMPWDLYLGYEPPETEKDPQMLYRFFFVFLKTDFILLNIYLVY